MRSHRGHIRHNFKKVLNIYLFRQSDSRSGWPELCRALFPWPPKCWSHKHVPQCLAAHGILGWIAWSRTNTQHTARVLGISLRSKMFSKHSWDSSALFFSGLLAALAEWVPSLWSSWCPFCHPSESFLMLLCSWLMWIPGVQDQGCAG